MSLSGPNPLGGPADLLIIAEEPGVGLGAGLAGLPGPDPGDGFASSQPNAAVKVANHDAPLWLVESDGKAVFVGEVAANWVWLVLWPDTAGTLLLEPLPLRDLRDPTQDLDCRSARCRRGCLPEPPAARGGAAAQVRWPPCALTCTCTATHRTARTPGRGGPPRRGGRARRAWR